MMFLRVAALAALTALVSADQQSFDCPMRQLALDFAAKAQPFRPKTSLSAVALALQGSALQSNCTLTVPTTAAQWPPAYPQLSAAESTFFVDAASGSDSNDGSEAHPFRTLSHAVGAARGAAHPATINLRAGTFYLQDTIELTPADSNLTIQAYNGEDVTISGGVPLKALSWKPYNISNSTMWPVYENVNAVFDDVSPPNVYYFGTTPDYEHCEDGCKANSTCNAWTWHDQHQTGYELHCYFRLDHAFVAHPQSGHVSGRREEVGKNIYVADLSGAGVKAVPGMRQNGQRLIRARYPNAQTEAGFGSNLMAQGWTPPTSPTNPAREVFPATPRRNNSFGFNRYQLGVGGPCENFDPPAGYWCGNETSGGGAFTYRVPSGMVADQSVLPNMPATGYTNVDKVEIFTWRPSHWSSWMFAVGSFDASSSTFKFSKGGFQGARGNDKGDNFYISNAFEELDAMDEWYFDDTTMSLYLNYNGTGAPPSDVQFVATNLKVLFNITGSSMADPVKGVAIKGVTLRDTAYTYLDPHGMPSGGDWGLQRTAAVFLQRTEGVQIDGCTFVRLDGNAVMVSAYNRGLEITRNEFSWIGDNVVAQWGNAVGSGVYGMGWDGTDGDQPRGSLLAGNLVHEIGVFEKQSSFYFQAKSCENTLLNNIVFNGPRAGINFNDGFGGGSNLTSNLVFNICRESGDHGPFNSWDRQLYVTAVRNGTASPYKAYDEITKNFMIANYESQEAIDNDDGSCYYHTHSNFFAYSGNGMKNDFGGHSNVHHDNVYAYIGHGFGIVKQDPGFADYFYNNHVVQSDTSEYGDPQCTSTSTAAKTVVYNNTIYTPTGTVNECGMPLAEWVAKGNDPGSSVHPYPADDTLLGLAKDVLEL